MKLAFPPRIPILALISSTLLTTQLFAQTSWNGGTGDWHTGSNWSAGVPTNAVNATANGGTLQITSADADTQNFGIDLGTEVAIGAGRTLTVHGDLNVTSGTTRRFTGDGNLVVNGTASFQTASISGGGLATFNGTTTINPASSLTVEKNIRSNGDTNWSGFDIFIESGNTWTNSSGATFTRNQGASNTPKLQLRRAGSGIGRFENEGTFVKTGSGTFDVEAGASNAQEFGRFVNSGVVRVEQGLMTIHNLNGVNGNVVFENTGTGSIEVANNSTFELSHGGTLAFTGGNLGGDGTIDADIVSMTGGNLNAGDFAGGTGTAELTIAGALEITDTTLNIEIGGTTQGTDFDYLNITGNTTLNGTTNVVVSFVNGFETSITNGDSFTVLNTAGFPNAPDLGNNITFDFSALNGDFVVAFTGNGGAGSGITLSGFTAVPEPTALTLLGISAAGFVFSRRRRS